MNINNDNGKLYDIKFSEVINKNMQLPDKIVVTSLMNNSITVKSDKNVLKIETPEFLSPEEYLQPLEEENVDDKEYSEREKQFQSSPGYSPNLISDLEIQEAKMRKKNIISLNDLEKRMEKMETRVETITKIGTYAGGLILVYFSLKLLNFILFRRQIS